MTQLGLVYKISVKKASQLVSETIHTKIVQRYRAGQRAAGSKEDLYKVVVGTYNR
jgi:hypothetical protein